MQNNNNTFSVNSFPGLESQHMKKIAVITGASSGMGRVFVETIDNWNNIDEVWAIARRKERLDALQCPVPVRSLAMDLTDRSNYTVYADLLAAEQAEVSLLVNAAGFGKFCGTLEVPTEENLNMVDLNCQALMALCQITIPYMPRGSRVINFSSVAADQPIPYINVYAATKAFVLSYGRALNRELKSRGIGVTTVCPFWTRTEFFDRAIDPNTEPVVKSYAAMYEPEQIVARAWRDAKRGKEVCRYGFIARSQSFLAKLLPHNLIMKVWMSQQKLK